MLQRAHLRLGLDVRDLARRASVALSTVTAAGLVEMLVGEGKHLTTRSAVGIVELRARRRRRKRRSDRG